MTVAVLSHVCIDPRLSTGQLYVVSGTSYKTIRRILKYHKFYQYKIDLVQELNEDEFDGRLQFCELKIKMLFFLIYTFLLHLQLIPDPHHPSAIFVHCWR